MKQDRTHLKIYTEIGFGNRQFISTEIEKGTSEKRVPGFVRFKMTGIYFRLWIGYTVYILSTQYGFETMRKPKRRIKIIVGLSGHGLSKIL